MVRLVTRALGLLLVLYVLAGVFPAARWLAWPLATADRLRRADAIVVLGAGIEDAETLSGLTAYRLLYGLRLFRNGYAPRLVLTGGNPNDPRVPESEVMARVALEFGVPREALIVEREALRTATQAEAVARIVRPRGIRSIVLVTSLTHSYRAARLFRKAGLEVLSAPAEVQQPVRWVALSPPVVFGRSCALGPVLYEYGALALYWWRGWL